MTFDVHPKNCKEENWYMNTRRKNLKSKGVATSKRQAFFPVSRVTFKVAFPNKTSKTGWWMGWVGSCVFNPNLGWMCFLHAFSSNDVCNAVTPLTHFGGDTQNLATSHPSMIWNICVIIRAFFTTCCVYNEWPTWFLDFDDRKRLSFDSSDSSDFFHEMCSCHGGTFL